MSAMFIKVVIVKICNVFEQVAVDQVNQRVTSLWSERML